MTLSTYYIGETEVTQELWKAVMGSNPSENIGDKRPVETVNWEDCQIFIRRLNQLTGKKFRLPTEAEWEFAARGGMKSEGYKYSGGNDIIEVAQSSEYIEKLAKITQILEDLSFEDAKMDVIKNHISVKDHKPNELGIYDMSGNVWEWCSDWYGDYTAAAQIDPKGASEGSRRVIRGGSWLSFAWACRSLYRGNRSPDYRGSDLGLRLVLLP